MIFLADHFVLPYFHNGSFQNIFLGEDIRRQLPGESSDFDDINVSWKYITSRLHDTRNVLRGTTEKG